MTLEQKWAAAFDALEQVRLELDGLWPVPYSRPPARVRGYCRERYRRAII